jgi:hypothetical protein
MMKHGSISDWVLAVALTLLNLFPLAMVSVVGVSVLRNQVSKLIQVHSIALLG